MTLLDSDYHKHELKSPNLKSFSKDFECAHKLTVTAQAYSNKLQIFFLS